MVNASVNNMPGLFCYPDDACSSQARAYLEYLARFVKVYHDHYCT